MEVKGGGVLNTETSDILNVCPSLPIAPDVMDQASETHKQQSQTAVSIGCPPSGLSAFYKAADGQPGKEKSLPIAHSCWPTVGAKDVMCRN